MNDNKMNDNKWKEELAEGIGCLLFAMGFAILIWTLSGFPGLD